MKNHYFPKALFFTFIFVSISFNAISQSEVNIAKSYLVANSTKQNLTQSDIDQMIVSSAYLSPTTGWYHIYFNQTHQSVEVYNGLLNVVLKNNQVQFAASSFIKNIAIKGSDDPLQLKIKPLDAFKTTIKALNIAQGNTKELSNTILTNGLLTQASYSDGAISNEKIEVKLHWINLETSEMGKPTSKLVLAWNVRFLTKDSKNGWNFQIDANSGLVLAQNDDVIHCDFGSGEHQQNTHICEEGKIDVASFLGNSPAAANTYTVFDYPLESPNHGSRTNVTDPFFKFAPSGTGTGATNGWHNDGATNYTTTRGNNVWAQEDINNNDGVGASPVSSILEFNNPYTFGLLTATGNQNASIVNLFYWNNLLHDVLWKYGFDEPSGNFQNNNLSRGGVGGDYIFADAQDGGGINNADFYPPSDGSNGRMQMYLWSATTTSTPYQPDGDFDNGIIAHEYGHGWSTRLAGGPANSGCLQNIEQGGEGWSDYLALMLTTKWANLTPTIASANIPRGIGTYAIGQPITGVGIRPYPYSYDKTNVNNTVTYAQVGNTSFSQPHGIGSIWATILWDMTWEIILQDGQIVNNIYNTSNMVGNVAALKLVNEGLRLQPCSPSFVDARNAILQADQMLFNGKYKCSISKAFSRRGVGASASTGASSNDRFVVEDFTPLAGTPLNSATTLVSICSGETAEYNATTAATGTTFSWTRPAIAGISNPASNGTGSYFNEVLNNTSSFPITVTYYFTVLPDACGASPQPVKIVVNPFVAAVVPNYNVCQNATVPAGEGLKAINGQISIVSGNIVAGNSYFRATGNSSTTYVASTNNVFYKTHTFVAPSTGSYTFETIYAEFGNDFDDSYLSLYQTSFNPASPATNFLKGDDDSGVGYLSKITQSLTTGTTYVLVVSTFTSGEVGPYQLTSSIPIFTGTTNWYKQIAGGSILATGSTFNPVGVFGSGIPNTATLGTTTFYAENSEFPLCRTPFLFVVGNPSVQAQANRITCQASPISLTASCPFGTAKWYNNAGTSLIFSGSPFITPPISASITYKVRCETSTVCPNGFTNVNVISVPPMANPTDVAVSATEICSGSTITLTANCAAGSTNWYLDATTPIIQFSGGSISQNPIVSTSYYVSCDVDACTSSRIATLPVRVGVLTPNLMVITDIITGTELKIASQILDATNKVIPPANVIYKAGNAINLNPGFEAQAGSIFKAVIGGCN
jgi:Fungalysin metallopeptidase (M36)/Ig-like domain CHU_C associated